MEDRRCRLGSQARLDLVRLIEHGSIDAEGGRGRFQRRAGYRASVVALLAGRRSER